MPSRVEELLKSGRNDDLWQLCCGFIDLTLDQFMNIQNNLMLEQIELLSQCELGKRLFGGAKPETVEEFRRRVPLTTYIDYCPDLLEKREDVLPAKPVHWIQTLGRAGEYPFKIIPISERFWEEAGLNFCAIALFGSSSRRGEVVLSRGMKLLYAAAPPPYITAAVAHKLAVDVGFKYLPELHEAQELSFEERVSKGFKSALSEGIDGFFGMGGVLMATSLKLNQKTSTLKKINLLGQPRALFRTLSGTLKSKRARRHLMPKDLWSLKVITTMGSDGVIFKDKIREMWGRTPLNIYGNTETVVTATQTWDYHDMVFFPNLNFLEFIPDEERIRSGQDKYYQPKTLLLDEVEAGKTYELVITNFHGGILTRYRVGDLVKINSLCNEDLGIDIPQMTLEGRADDLIDLGYMRVTERVIWQALENTGIPYKEWTARREMKGTPKLHVYIELAPGYYTSTQEVAERLYEAIKKLDNGLYVYSEISSLETLIDCKPIIVTILPEGGFSSYKHRRQAQGADMGDLKPPHVNPSDKDLLLLGVRSKPLAEEWAEATLLNSK
jgi:hypothetical protein